MIVPKIHDVYSIFGNRASSKTEVLKNIRSGILQSSGFQIFAIMVLWIMGIFKKNENVFENGTHGGPECVIIIRKAELKIGRSTVNKLCGICPVKDEMIRTRLQGSHISGLYMGSDGQPRLKNCKVSSLAFDAAGKRK